MTLSHLYPVICSSDFPRSVAYYEDYFDFIPVWERDGVALLQRQGCDCMHLVCVDKNAPMVPDAYKRATGHAVLSFTVENVDLTYQELYWEGLDIVQDPTCLSCGRKNFIIEGPDGVLISIVEAVQKAQEEDAA